jgi:uncharacterized membrane protein
VPVRWLAALSVAVILFHNLLDGKQASQFGSGAWVWNLPHRPDVVSVAGTPVWVSYTFLPRIAVISAVYCFAQVFLLEPAQRRRIKLRTGLALTAAFVVIGAVNLYRDPRLWSHQKSAVFTVLSFLNCTKYPGSVDFLRMTLGPSLLMLAYLDPRSFKISNPLIVFGRVPMFYFLLHFYLIHDLAVLAAWLR